MPVEFAYLNPKATVLVDIEGESRLFEPEADLKRLKRQAAWQLITQSITDMPDVNWKSVELGNVYGLYSLITSHSRENDMKSAVGWGSTSLYVKLKPPLPPPKSSPRKPERVVLSEAQRVAELQAHIRETAREMTEQLQIEHAQSESRGVRKEVIFLEYLSSVPVEKAYLNPKATILVTFEDVTKLFEPESDLKRLQRQSGWQLITQSISDMPPANWKSIALGNVHGLYTLITSHYRENDRKSVVKALNERLTAVVSAVNH